MGKLSVAQAVCGLMAATAPASGVQLPNLTGRFPVGTISLELVDYSRVDTLAPSPQPRALMASIFYPTSENALQSGNYTFAPAYPPATASIFDNYIGAPAGTAGSIITQSLLGAPISRPDLPILVFGHGFSGTRLIHTAQVEDLASQGWIVVSVDHTYDAIVVEFPDGRLVPGLSLDSSDYPGGPDGLSEIRAADVAFVVSALQNKTVLTQIPGLQRCGEQRGLQTDRIGVFGVSLGGAAAAEALAKYTTFACGANFDGSIHGNLNQFGLDKPFLIMAAEDHNRTNDESWSKFWGNLHGFRREFKVDGAVHMTFTDIPVLLELLGSAVPVDQYGTIDGRRILEIDTAFMNAFFGYCLKGQPDSQLDGLAGGNFTEVSVGY